MALSVLVALILTPALCATMLKPIQKGSHGATTGFFGWFNRMFDKSTHHYTDSVGNILRSTGRSPRLPLTKTRSLNLAAQLLVLGNE